jgi:predicted GIY-YIG superfamily endonuclease
VYVECAADRSAAQKREHEIKRMSAAEKKSLIANASRGAKRW